MVAYGGKLSGDASNLKNSPTIRAHLDSLRIDQHPLLGSAGVRGGTLSFHTDGLSISPDNQLPQGSFAIEINQLDPPEIPNLKSILKVDTVGPLDLKGQGTCSSNTIRVDRAELTSPFATITGSATVNSATSPNPDIRGDFRITLTDRGSQTFGPWLSLVTGGVIQSSAQSFQAQLSTRPCSAIRPGQPRLAVGTRCLDYAFRP
jgi:hypothetical protein